MATPRRRVLVTRPEGQAEVLCARLRAIGIDPVAVPTVAILSPHSFDALDLSLRRLHLYQWVVFTSVNGVRSLFERGAALGLTVTAPPSTRWAAIGPATAAHLSSQGIPQVWVPTRFVSSAIAEELPAVLGSRILWIRADIATPVLAEQLRTRGAVVDEVVAYRTVEAPAGAGGLLAEAMRSGVDAVVFTSASTVRGFAQLLEANGEVQRVRELELIAIGPVTAAAISAMGWPVHQIADEYSIDGIIRLLKGGDTNHVASVDRT